MKFYFLSGILSLFLCSITFSQVTESDRLFKTATDLVKERKYAEALTIFENLANNNEYDAQYNLAFLISSGKGTTKNYREALYWALLSMLGKIEKGEKLSEELIEILPEKESEDVREEVLEHLIARFERKDADVLMQLGDFYLSVLEEEDFENAYLWFNVASAVGIENADEKRDKVEKKLEPDTIIKVQLAARERHKEFINGKKPNNKKETKSTEKEYES
tara:strand:+ start:1074 stop:1733 length:660 start_codon:yes stop_codon:yes gene_type:complete